MAGLKRRVDGVRGAEHDQQVDATDVTPGSGSRASGRIRATRGGRARGASSVVSSPENNASIRPDGYEENGQPSGDISAEAKSELSVKRRKVAEPSDPSTPTRQSARIKARSNSSSSVDSSPSTRLHHSTEHTINGESEIGRESTPDNASSRSSQAGDEGSPVQLVEQPPEPESNVTTPSNRRRLPSPEEEEEEEETPEINGKVENEDGEDDQEEGGEEEEKQTTSPPTPEAADDVQADEKARAAPAVRGRGRGRGGRGRGFRGRGRGGARGSSSVRGRGRGRGGFRGGGRLGRRGADDESDFELDRSPSPTPAIIKLQDRQKELKQAFKRLAGAQRLALNVLGTLTQQRLIKDKNAHRRVPEYEEVQQDLQERLHQRQEILRHRYELQVEQENRLFEAQKEVLENRLRTTIKHVHEEHLHAAQGAYIAFVEGIRTAEDDEHTEPDIDQAEPTDVAPKTEREGSVESNYEPLYMDEPRIVRGYFSSFIRTPSGAAQCELGEKRWEDFVKRARIQEISQEAAPVSGPDPLVSLLEASESIAVSEEPPVALQALADTAINSIGPGIKAEESTTYTTAATTAAPATPTITSLSTTTTIATTAGSSAAPPATTSASTSQLPPLLPQPPPTPSTTSATAAPTTTTSSTQQPAPPPPPPPVSASSASQLPPIQPQRPTIPRPTLPSLHGLPDPFGNPSGGPPTLPPPPGMTFPPRRDSFPPPSLAPPPPPPPTQPHPHAHPHHPNYSRSYEVPPPQHPPPHPPPHPQHPGPYGWLPPLRGYDMRNPPPPPPPNPPPPRRPY